MASERILAIMPWIWSTTSGREKSSTSWFLQIQYGTSFCYPVSSMGAHVSAVPNHQVNRVTPLYTRPWTEQPFTV